MRSGCKFLIFNSLFSPASKTLPRPLGYLPCLGPCYRWRSILRFSLGYSQSLDPGFPYRFGLSYGFRFG